MMNKLDLIPAIAGYSVGLPQDVATAKNNGLPVKQTRISQLPYVVQLSFINKGKSHDELIKFIYDNMGKYVLIKLILDDHRLRWHECLFDGEPRTSYLGGRMLPKPSPADFNDGTADTSQRIYQLDATVIVPQKDRHDLDRAILENFKFITNDPFREWTYAD